MPYLKNYKTYLHQNKKQMKANKHSIFLDTFKI